MKELVFVESKGQEPFTTSEIIANCTGINHRRVKDAIRKNKEALKSFGLLGAYQTESTGGRPQEIFKLNEQQATFLITLLKNTPSVLEFKKELVRQFYAMRSLLMEKKTPVWQDTRQLAKEIRKRETDTIKAFVNYAKEQGSQHAQRYYTNFSKLADQAAGIKDREIATVMQLNTLQIVERILTASIENGIAEKKPYKTIFTDCRERLSLLLAPCVMDKGA